MAPVGVLADFGTMMGGGRGPVYGIRIKGFCIDDTLRERSGKQSFTILSGTVDLQIVIILYCAGALDQICTVSSD